MLSALHIHQVKRERCRPFSEPAGEISLLPPLNRPKDDRSSLGRFSGGKSEISPAGSLKGRQRSRLTWWMCRAESM